MVKMNLSINNMAIIKLLFRAKKLPHSYILEVFLKPSTTDVGIKADHSTFVGTET